MMPNQKLVVPNFNFDFLEKDQETTSLNFSPTSKMSSARTSNSKVLNENQKMAYDVKSLGAHLKIGSPKGIISLASSSREKPKCLLEKKQHEVETEFDKAVRAVTLKSLLTIKNAKILEESEIVSAFALVELLKRHLDQEKNEKNGFKGIISQFHEETSLENVKEYFDDSLGLMEAIKRSKALYRTGNISSSDVLKSKCILSSLSSDKKSEFSRNVGQFITSFALFCEFFPEKKLKLISSSGNSGMRSPNLQGNQIDGKKKEENIPKKGNPEGLKEEESKETDINGLGESVKPAAKQEENHKENEAETHGVNQSETKTIDESERVRAETEVAMAKEPEMKETEEPFGFLSNGGSCLDKTEGSQKRKQVHQRALSSKQMKVESRGSKTDRFMTRQERIMSLKTAKPLVESKLGLCDLGCSRAQTTRTRSRISKNNSSRDNFSVDSNQSHQSYDSGLGPSLLFLQQRQKLMHWEAEREAKRVLEEEQKAGLVKDIKSRLSRENKFNLMIKEKIRNERILLKKVKEEQFDDIRKAKQQIQKEEKHKEKKTIHDYVGCLNCLQIPIILHLSLRSLCT